MGLSFERSVMQRIGLSALNLAAPGLGLLRIGDWRDGLLLMAVPPALLLLSAALFALAPTATLLGALIYIFFLVVSLIAILATTIILTWRRSGRLYGPTPWWSRWYSLLAVWLLSSIGTSAAVTLDHRTYKPFYVPSEAMAPTLVIGDKVIADMRQHGVAIGDVVLIRSANGAMYVKRVAALAGDRIAMSGGRPVRNGIVARQHIRGTTQFLDYEGMVPATNLVELLPGEASSHAILDIGPSLFDDMAERRVPRDHLFVLGDNRDRSADSRMAIADGGLAMVSVDQIVGRPLFIHWATDRQRIGTRLTRR